MRQIHTAIQMIVVGILTTLIAYLLKLEYWYTSGVIAILSINMTKKDTIKVALNRSFGVVIALLLSTVLFLIGGYVLWIYLIFLAIFIMILWILNISEGIVVSIVLVNHLLLRQSFDQSLLLNEIYIYLLALCIALLVNLLYPKVHTRKMEKQVDMIDMLVKEHMFALSLFLKDLDGYEVYQEHYRHIEKDLDNIIKEAEMLEKDQIVHKNFDYKTYLMMRKSQLDKLNHMYILTHKIKSKETVIEDIAEFIVQLCNDIGKDNKAGLQLEKLKTFRLHLEGSALPKSRAEFETRAILYQILNDIEAFLQTKERYHAKAL